MVNIFTVNAVFNISRSRASIQKSHYKIYSNTVGCYILHYLNYIKYLLSFFLAGICDWLSCSRCSRSAGRAGGGVWRGGRRKRIRIIDKGLPPLSLLDHLYQAVGHKHDDDGGYREAWEGREMQKLIINKVSEEIKPPTN